MQTTRPDTEEARQEAAPHVEEKDRPLAHTPVRMEILKGEEAQKGELAGEKRVSPRAALPPVRTRIVKGGEAQKMEEVVGEGREGPPLEAPPVSTERERAEPLVHREKGEEAVEEGREGPRYEPPLVTEKERPVAHPQVDTEKGEKAQKGEVVVEEGRAGLRDEPPLVTEKERPLARPQVDTEKGEIIAQTLGQRVSVPAPIDLEEMTDKAVEEKVEEEVEEVEASGLSSSFADKESQPKKEEDTGHDETESSPERPPAALAGPGLGPGPARLGPIPSANFEGGAVPGLRLTVWDQQERTMKYPPLEENLTADVCVVGAGINGLSLAYYLQRHGVNVVVLEARIRGSGQTGRTTAHLMVWNDDYYYVLERTFGRGKAMMVADSHMKSIDFVERTVREEKIDCDFQRVDGYLFLADDKVTTMRTLRKEHDACLRLGLGKTQLVDLGSEPSSGNIGTCLRFPDCADFHPLKYLDGLADAVVRKGGKIYEMSRVWSHEGNVVTTRDGFSVKADAIVLATNSPINHNVAIHARQTACRTYVIGLHVPTGSVRRAQWWDTMTPYHYVRLQVKDGYDVLIVGGGDHNSGMKPKQYRDVWAELEIWARERWTMAQEVVYKWTGQVYEPADYLGLYGPDPLNPWSAKGTFISTGNSGQGMTGGTISAMVIGDRIMGRSNPWVEVYDPKRALPFGKPWMSAAEEATVTTEGYLDILPLKGADVLSIEDVPRGCGAVIQDHLMKVATYRDEKGVIHRFSGEQKRYHGHVILYTRPKT